ncbi:MAG: GGDEF domain-containing protein [Deltaproteobacteria bacterium]|nr:GGDEF domain-containing protein [Deltaproteobacteria bacterium]
MLPTDLTGVLARDPTVPTLPAVAARVLALASDNTTGAAELGRIITSDAGLSARLLKVANSPFYAGRQRTTKITDAVVLLGMRAVRNLVLSVSVLDLVGRGAAGNTVARRLWERSLHVAVLARSLAQRTALDGEEAFVLGLLTDVGALAMIQFFGSSYAQCEPRDGQASAEVLARERAVFGLDHQAAGRLLAERWNLPPSHCAAIATHHAPPYPGLACDLPGLLNAAAALVHSLCDERRLGALRAARQGAAALTGLTPAGVDELLAVLPEKVAEVVADFELGLEAPMSFVEGALRANEQLADINLKLEQLTRELEDANQKLAAIASEDGLTGLANRRSFDEALRREALRVGRYGGSLVLAMADVDHFKRCNDTHGHQVGDEVLRRFARLLSQAVRPSDLVARYGGEEFVILFTETGLQAAGLAANRLRDKLASEAFDSGTGPFNVTASFGLAALEPLSDVADPSRVVKRADDMLYRAKQTGRNRVCWE